eukprot:3128445-Alexandrium_andersonii.AAC.1
MCIRDRYTGHPGMSTGLRQRVPRHLQATQPGAGRGCGGRTGPPAQSVLWHRTGDAPTLPASGSAERD